jgi:hypothetical protein
MYTAGEHRANILWSILSSHVYALPPLVCLHVAQTHLLYPHRAIYQCCGSGTVTVYYGSVSGSVSVRLSPVRMGPLGKPPALPSTLPFPVLVAVLAVTLVAMANHR